MIIALLGVAFCVIAEPAMAQAQNEWQAKPVKVKKWRKYDVGEILFNDKAPQTEGSQIYNRLIPNPEEYIAGCAREVLATLYFSPKDKVTPVQTLKYTLEDREGISAKSGGNGRVHIFYSTRHVEKSYKGSGDEKVFFETRGVLLHELTHAYQLEPQGIGTYSTNKTFWVFIEGMADAVRVANGGFYGEQDRSIRRATAMRVISSCGCAITTTPISCVSSI